MHPICSFGVDSLISSTGLLPVSEGPGAWILGRTCLLSRTCAALQIETACLSSGMVMQQIPACGLATTFAAEGCLCPPPPPKTTLARQGAELLCWIPSS